MQAPRALLLGLLPLLLGPLASCSVLTVDSASGPPRVESRGLIESHVALGFSDEDRIVHATLFDGRSDGAIAELSLWKLFRLELGLAGASISLGPLHLGLGVLFYDPEVPVERAGRDREHSRRSDEHTRPRRPESESESESGHEHEHGTVGDSSAAGEDR